MESRKQNVSSHSSLIQPDESIYAVRLTQEECIQFSNKVPNSLLAERAMEINPIQHPGNAHKENIPPDAVQACDQVFLVRDRQDLLFQLRRSLSHLRAQLHSTNTSKPPPPTVDEDDHIEPEDEEEELNVPTSGHTETTDLSDSPSPDVTISASDDDEGSLSVLEEEVAETKEEDRQTTTTTTFLATDTSILSTTTATSQQRIVFSLSNLPPFNMVKIISSLCVRERLANLCLVSKRFRACVYQPQCFADVSFFPIVVQPPREPENQESTATDDGANTSPDTLDRPAPPRRSSPQVPAASRPPKMLHVRGTQVGHQSSPPTGITYVEVCMESQHPFIVKVARYAGMWNFKAELWERIDWPSDLVIESLQLSIDANTDKRILDLHDELPTRSQSKISNLFLIKFEMDGFQPKIFFPQKLQGLGLQSFNSTCFAASWWKNQVYTDGFGVFDSIIFLVLSCCDFENNELQNLIHRVGDRLEHLSLRYVKWEGVVTIPSNLVSLGWFPERATNFFRFDRKKPNRLWQLQTRLAENLEGTVEMLNCVHELCPNLRKISFEYIRAHEEWHASRLDVDSMKVWGNVSTKMEEGGIDSNEEEDEEGQLDERFSSMVVVVDPAQWIHQPELESVFVLSEHQFVHPTKTSFLDCPLWSEDARSFISMTVRRKLLLR